MNFKLSRDFFNNPQPPELYLCNTGRKILGQLPAYDLSGTFKWNSYSEIQFSVDRVYTDILSGGSVIHPLFDKVEGLRNVYLKNIGYFTLQDSDTTYSDKDTKKMTAFSLEYATAGSKYLDNFRINTGDVDSKEVIYESSKYGNNATVDDMYKPARYDSWDSSKTYYQREYDERGGYTYTPIQIADESTYQSYFGDDIPAGDVLYIHGYANVQFYDPYTPELSLLDLIFEKIPEWKIGHVDYSLRNKERKFDEDHIAVYDFLTNNVSDTFRAVVEWDSIKGEVNFYEEAEDGINEDGTIQTRWDTDVFISRENLASEVSISYSTDDIKTKLKVSGSDDLDIREVNLGKNYILNLDYYHDEEWMDKSLMGSYDNYLKAVQDYSEPYTASMQNWVAAYNRYDELMNAVPAEGNVVLVGDEFKKLYCIYGLYNSVKEFTKDTTYYIMREDGSMAEADTQPTAENFSKKTYYVKGDYTTKESELIKKLTLYHVNTDIKANESDNILLKLKNNVNDVATIRIYNASTEGTDAEKKDNPVYKIQTLVVSASTGKQLSEEIRDLSDWINGDLRVNNTANNGMSFLNGFKVSYIGVMGAYFVLAKDEREESTLDEYGVNLLREKHDTYVTIFQTQTEAMFSQQKYQCIIQNEQPSTNYDIGTRWLDTNSSPVKLYQMTEMANADGIIVKNWALVSNAISDDDMAGYENYQRYLDNYDKMVAVQNQLIKKEKEAAYFLDGYAVLDVVIDVDRITSDEPFYRAAYNHFKANDYDDSFIIEGILNSDYSTKEDGTLNITGVIPIYTFTTTKTKGEFAVYVVGSTPYVAYEQSQGIYMAQMNAMSNLVELEKFFTKEQWIELSPLIREDEYTNDNFLLTGYESEEERLKICEELIEDATKELKTLAQPKLEFSMTMANILALPEFDPIVSQFALGNFVRIELRPGIVKRARLLEVNLNFDDLSDFSADFGNLVETLDEVDKHAQLLSQAVQAGKTVAAAASEWQAGVDKANKLEEDIANGLADATLEVGRASNQSIVWNENGIWCRRRLDGETDQFDDEQIRIINNKILYSSDGFKTSKSAFGSFTYNGQRYSGVLADALVGGLVQGATIVGGKLRIGNGDKNYFEVDEDGDVQIVSAGEEKYASKSAIDEINKAYQYTVELSYNGSTVFASTGANTIITAIVRDLGEDITHKLPVNSDTPTVFTWLRNGEVYHTTTMNSTNKPTQGVINTNINALTANQINITHEDIENNSFFSCQVDFDETKIL